MNISDKIFLLTKKESKLLNLFWLGFTMYAISYTYAQTGHLNYTIPQALQSLGLILIVGTSVQIIRLRPIDSYLKNIFLLYCLWLFFIVLRGWTFNYGYIKKILFDASYGMMPYFAPLILLFPKNISSYKKVFNVIIIFCIFYLIYDIVFIKDLISGDRSSIKSTAVVEYAALLSIPACFLLLTFPYHTFKKNILALLVVTVTLLFAILRARRGMILICLSQLTLVYFLYLGKSKNKVFIVATSVLILLTGVYYTKTIFLENKVNIFSFLLERGTQDTRTGVEEYFFNDLNTSDWISGKGINGQYFCPDIDENSVSGYRRIIETGYLQIILNGGIISLVLILLISVPAFIKGIFYSKNTLSKAAGYWILLWVLYLYPTTMQGFSLYYALFWLSVGICYSKALRNIPESQMKLLFLSKEPVLEISY